MLSSCGDQPRTTSFLERSDSAGLEVVRVRTAPPDTLSWEPAVRIGSDGLNSGDEVTFGLISDLLVVDEGVLVIDYISARVDLFDLSGTWVADVGQRGIGPGEHTGPFQARVLGDSLFIWDLNARRLSWYLDREFAGSVALPSWSGASHFAVRPGGGYVRQVESGQLIDPAPARGALVRMNAEGEVIDTLIGPYPIPEYGWEIDSSGRGSMVNPPALAISPPWLIEGHMLVHLDPLSSTVEVHDLEVGGLRRVIHLPHSTVLPTAEDQDRFFRGLQAEFGFPDEAMGRTRATTTFAQMRPQVAGVLVDDLGRIWVAEHDPAFRGRAYVGSSWDIYDLDTDEGYRVSFPEGFHLKAVRDGHAFGITTLDTGSNVVDILRLE